MPRKLSLNYIKDVFRSEGYLLITDRYINNTQKLWYICSNGHRHYITWSNWNHPKRYRCPYCYGNVKYTLDHVKSALYKEGYVLTSKNYLGANNNLSYTCPEGHPGTITFSNWLRGHRCFECSYTVRSGPNHVNWKGGISCEPYCQDWTKELKEFIKERDGYKCLNPYCNSKNKTDLTIHHIDYDKKNCSTDNLITVCRSCNSAANKDRRWHWAWYKAIINRRYGG